MAVSVKIVNKVVNEENNEYQAALALRDMLQKSFDSHINGKIGIAYGLTLYGQATRDIDILLFGEFENYILSSFYTNDPKYSRRNLSVDNFCIAIELKEHPFDRVRVDSTHINVKYQSKWKDATEQNEKQRYSCSSYLKVETGNDIYTTNFIWLKSLTKEQLDSISGNNGVGALSANFSFKDIVNIIKNQGAHIVWDNADRCYHMASCAINDFYQAIANSLFKEKEPISGLTRRKLEILNQRNINDNIGVEENKLNILKGRAGTGKTFHLIQSALNLANEESGKRCLILTYNHALVSDIQRLLHFMEIPDGIDNYTIQIQTLHSFFIRIMNSLGISTNTIVGDRFEREYKNSLFELLDYVTKLMDDRDIKILKDENDFAIDWDYIFVDEAQDWMDAEKDILFKIYGRENIVVADGVDQFVRANHHLQWGRGGEVSWTKLQVGMRQKTNLVNFVNSFAYRMGIDWKIKKSNLEQWAGGEIIIVKDYNSTLHGTLLERCKKAGGDSYDLLFLIPYQMVPGAKVGNEITPISLETWRSAGIKLFNGTKRNERARYGEQYSTKTDECRLYQYDSCRGLEGWATVCFKFDILVQNKFDLANDMDFEDSITLCSQEDLISQYVYKWSLIPLTRPVDTLVITLHNPNSEIGKVLKEMSENECSDFMTWSCE